MGTLCHSFTLSFLLSNHIDSNSYVVMSGLHNGCNISLSKMTTNKLNTSQVASGKLN
jgi:hypothetical protein